MFHYWVWQISCFYLSRYTNLTRFSGDDDEQNRWLDLCYDFIPERYWSTHHKDLNAISMTARLRQRKDAVGTEDALPGNRSILPAPVCEPFAFSALDRKAMEQERLARLGKRKRSPSPDLQRKRSPKPSLSKHELFNPREGCHDSWQLGESVADFVKRVPPLTTSNITCEWIWVMNPLRNPQDKSAYLSVGDFRDHGLDLLGQSLKKRHEIRLRGAQGPKAMLTRLLNEESKALQERIISLAVKNNVLSGKVSALASFRKIATCHALGLYSAVAIRGA